ncbi:MAG: transglycosylase SLT domain-containing protein [bacterium]|nr:transglycosylase SLT domain-containing protein [bacterium]
MVSVIMVESTFKKNQVSDSGAAGLMQLRPL